MEYKDIWETYTEEDRKDLFDYGDRYKEFISRCKTERECTRDMVRIAESHGYENLEDLIDTDRRLEAGSKVYANYNDRALVMFCIGKEPLTKGLNILEPTLTHLD